MGRVWVLDTETKGTGAEMVPLDKVQRRPAPSKEPFWVPPERHPRTPKPAEPRAPLKFRIVDVQVYIREREQWRLLTLDELRTLWGARTRQPAQAG